MISLDQSILLVDDDEFILVTYKALLELEGYHVLEATNPYKALQIVEKNKINLAILDYNLPNMNGIQLGHLIHKLQEEAKIMFISGNESINELVKDAKYSVSAVLCKPIEPSHLTNTVKSLTGEPEPPTEKPKQEANKVQNLIRLFKISYGELKQVNSSSLDFFPV